MMTVQVFTGASLFALLIVDICCFPVKDFNPGAATDFGSHHGAPSGQFSPGPVPYNAPAGGAAMPSYEAASQPEHSFSQPAVRRQPVASSRPVQPGYIGNSVSLNLASSTQPGTLQPAYEHSDWAVEPPTAYSGGEAAAAGTHVGSRAPENVSPPGPMYQGGELSNYEQSLETGDSELETEERSYLPSPMELSAESVFAMEPVPMPLPGDFQGPFLEYLYLFLHGLFPQGTLTHSSSSSEQGNDNWQDVHYERYYYPEVASPAQQPQTFASYSAPPQTFKDPKSSMQNPTNTGYPSAVHGASHGGFRQPTLSVAGGNYMTKGGY